ncbi:MAG: DnaJ domain-containing protein, partial [Bacteroidales bacterium]|nr:DnaJ domain-containing protein [Bacteroidales bacterium]
MLIQTYFNILKLTHNASVDDIHRAYRIRAKELHPDINTSPHAHNDFLLLQEAYNFLLANYDDIMLFYKKEK